MKICGIKLTHDGGVAVIEDNRLKFCVEIEKVRNGFRHDPVVDFNQIKSILHSESLDFADINRIAIDGWCLEEQNADFRKAELTQNGKTIAFKLAKYGNAITKEDVLESQKYAIKELGIEYSSYMHVTGHIMGAYCTSPFVREKQSSFILIWDGGMFPQLFYLHHNENRIEPLGSLFSLNGYCYTGLAQRFPPFTGTRDEDLSIAGKLMAYIALGKIDNSIQRNFRDIYNGINKNASFQTEFINRMAVWGESHSVDPKDLLTNYHFVLSELLLETLEQKIRQYPAYSKNLCFAGGCALNIKWNSDLRRSADVSELWVPPFPNDSGSAIGVACCEMVKNFGFVPLEWDVYSGPRLQSSLQLTNWERTDFDLQQLAVLLHSSNQPIIFLNGRAELGPRALGSRSILASPASLSMKEKLNAMKRREQYRPVAPICLEEDATIFFDPGTPDPYMLFDHKVRKAFIDVCPSVIHHDGTARLQTVNKLQNKSIYELLSHFKKVSGLPLLCNTSANFNGRGFFPDVASAMKWDEANFIWSEGSLYFKRGASQFLD